MIEQFKNDFRGYGLSKPSRSNVPLSYNQTSKRPLIYEHLKKDFLGRCGYCGWSCSFYGAERFNIDHFNPSLKGTAKDSYDNYVFACPICNKTKNDSAIPTDPIHPNFSKYFVRNEFGRIMVNTKLSKEEIINAKCIHENLGFNKEIYAFDYYIMSLDLVYNHLIVSSETINDHEMKDTIHLLNRTLSKIISRKTTYKIL